MAKQNLPVYAIVELLMRLSHYNKRIGDYRGHTVRPDTVLVKTSGGTINFSQSLIMQQFEDPELVTHDALVKAVSLFNAARVKPQTISR
jgi:hypothetical protein